MFTSKHNRNMVDIRFNNDSVFTVAGPSSSGKTVFVQKLIKHRKVLFKNNVSKIHWFFSIIPPPHDSSDKIHLHKGLVDGWSDSIAPYDMVILDDLFMESSNSKEVTNAFTRLAHHIPCTIIFITQNLFHRSNDSRTRALNTHYLVLMKNPRDASQISHLARQMYPNQSKFLVDVYKHVTENNAFSYILLDFRQETPMTLRVRSHIFPNEPHAAYINNLPK